VIMPSSRQVTAPCNAVRREVRSRGVLLITLAIDRRAANTRCYCTLDWTSRTVHSLHV